MDKIVLTTNNPALVEKVEAFAKLLSVDFQVQANEATVLPFTAPAPPTVGMTMEQLECEAISKAIVAHKGNLSEAAKSLNIGRATLYRKVKQYQINTKEARTKKVA